MDAVAAACVQCIECIEVNADKHIKKNFRNAT